MQERPAAGVHRSGILERAPRVRLYARIPELVGGLGALGRVTGLAGDGEVADAVRAASCLGHDVLDLQGHILRATVGAPPAELLQQILADLITGPFALLVFHFTDVRLLKKLCIEADQLLRDSANGSIPSQSRYPGQHIADARLQGGW